MLINDNKLFNNDINENWKEVGQGANDAGGTRTKTEKIIERSSFEIRFRLMTKHKKKKRQSNTDPMTFLIKECDHKARKVLEGTNDYQVDKPLDEVGNQCMT